MRLQPQDYHCLKCKHEWVGEMLIDVEVDAWLKVMRSLRCPNCATNTRSILMGHIAKEEPAADAWERGRHELPPLR